MTLAQIRAWQFTQLENNIQSIERVIRMADPVAITTYRDGGTGWTALEILGHLNDFEAVFSERVHVTVEQENGALPFPPAGCAGAGASIQYAFGGRTDRVLEGAPR